MSGISTRQNALFNLSNYVNQASAWDKDQVVHIGGNFDVKTRKDYNLESVMLGTHTVVADTSGDSAGRPFWRKRSANQISANNTTRATFFRTLLDLCGTEPGGKSRITKMPNLMKALKLKDFFGKDVAKKIEGGDSDGLLEKLNENTFNTGKPLSVRRIKSIAKALEKDKVIRLPKIFVQGKVFEFIQPDTEKDAVRFPKAILKEEKKSKVEMPPAPKSPGKKPNAPVKSASVPKGKSSVKITSSDLIRNRVEVLNRNIANGRKKKN